MNFKKLVPFGMGAIAGDNEIMKRERSNSEMEFAIEKYDETFQELLANYQDPKLSN
jgi:hypothetical protein